MVSFRLLDLAFFFTLVDIIDRGNSGARATRLLMEGDLAGAWDTVSENAKAIFGDRGQFAKIISALFLRGGLELVTDAFNFQKAVTVGNVTVGI